MSDGKIDVLFVCEDNSILSIIAESLLNRLSRDRFRAFSCGHRPANQIHPRTLELLGKSGLSLQGSRPKSLNDFVGDGAPEMDLVINLSDEPLPRMPGCPIVARWRITHPASPANATVGESIAFRRTLRELENRIRLIALLRHPTREERRAREMTLAHAA